MPVYRCVEVQLTGDESEKLGKLLAKLALLLAEKGLEELKPRYDSLTMKAGHLRVEAGWRDPPEDEEEYTEEAYIKVCSDRQGYAELAQLLNRLLGDGEEGEPRL